MLKCIKRQNHTPTLLSYSASLSCLPHRPVQCVFFVVKKKKKKIALLVVPESLSPIIAVLKGLLPASCHFRWGQYGV